MKRLPSIFWCAFTMAQLTSWRALGQDQSTIQFTAAAYAVTEGDSVAVITFSRTGNPNTAAKAQFFTANGTATAGADYVAQDIQISFGPGETSTSAVIPILDDGLLEGDETILLGVRDPVGASLGGRSDAVLTIHDNERAVSVDPRFSLAVLHSFVNNLIIQPNGQLLVGGYFAANGGSSEGGVLRLNPDGSKDPNFNSPPVEVANRGLALQPDGKVLVAGWTNLLRLGTDGALDSTFHPETGGQFVALQPDGRVLTARGGALVRLNPDGSLDPEFAPDIKSNPGPTSKAFSCNWTAELSFGDSLTWSMDSRTRK
jgi:uncharacterized delta-60 repeat protein